MKISQFNNWNILPKIMTISIMSVVIIDAIILFYFLPMVEVKILEGDKRRVQQVVEVAWSLVAEYDRQVQLELLTKFDAQIKASLDLANLRYSEKEYFWINDLTPKIIMHPVKTELDGQDVSGFKDPNGKYLFKEFVKVCNEKGSGFVDYMWPKPGEAAPVPKISYVKLYKPWGWIIGSGVYIDDVKAEMNKIRFQVIFGTAFFAMVTLFLAYLIGRRITRPLKEVFNGLQEISRGRGNADLAKPISITSADEIGLLTGEFNGLMESINKMSVFKKVIEEDDNLDDVYNRLGDIFCNELGLCDCVIYEVDCSLNLMTAVFPPFLSEKGIYCNSDILANCELCKAKKTGHTISSATYPNICKQFLPGSVNDHHCIPLIVGGSPVGVVQFITGKQHIESEDPAKQRDAILTAEHYIQETLPVIETKRLMKRLRDSALTDAMTGLRNRRFLEEYMDKLVAGILRRNKTLGLVMCDLDYFKQVNDQHGHDAGDAVLKETAKILRESLRDSDLAIRFGGEEFLVLLMDIEPESSMMVAEKIRKNIESASFKIPDGSIKKTLSLGVSEFPKDATSLWQAIKFADVALYRAKEGGRNRSVRFTEEMWTEQQF